MRAFDTLVLDMAPGTRCLIGDAGYDADRVRQELLLRGVLPVIPSNPARNEPLPLDRELYRLRNRVERLSNKLKQFRAVATRGACPPAGAAGPGGQDRCELPRLRPAGGVVPLAQVRPQGLALLGTHGLERSSGQLGAG
jgi:transposase